MTELENSLRKAFRAKASEITPPPPPLELQPLTALDPAARRGSGKFRAPLQHRLVPLAAAVAVIAVVAGALAVGGARPARRTPPAAPIQTSVPPYYVALVNNGLLRLGALPHAMATVRETGTGTVIARLSPPRPYVSFDAVSGAADDRTFVLEARGNPIPVSGVIPERFYLLRITPSATSAAKRARLTALPAIEISGGYEVGAMALSPDGSSLAAILTHGIQGYLHVYNLTTGTTRTWVRKPCSGCGQSQDELGVAVGIAYPAAAVSLSWTADGNSLAFVPGGGFDQLRLLDLGAPGDNVQPNSRPFAIHGVPVSQWSEAYMTPDAKTVFISYNESRGKTDWNGLLRYSARTGNLTRINKTTRYFEGHLTGYGSDTVLWASYDGSELIVTGARRAPVLAAKQFPFVVVPDRTAGIYRGDRYSPIPWPAYVIDAAW